MIQEVFLSSFVFTVYNGIDISIRLIGFTFFLQSFENLKLKKLISDDSPWSRITLIEEYPKSIQRVLFYLFSPKLWSYLVIIQMICSLKIVFGLSSNLICISYLLFFQLLIALRFRGLFHGGADTMSLITLFGQFAIHLEKFEFGLYWIAAQVTFSYLIAGLSKLINPSWRNEKILDSYLNAPRYDVRFSFGKKQRLVDLKFGKSQILFQWFIILFEILFPMIWFVPSTTFIFLPFAALFHFGVFLVFGLNRFFWIWISSFPIILHLIFRGLAIQ